MYLSEKIPDLKIYAFEPIPQTFKALQENLKNNSSIAKVYNIGLSNQEKNVEFNFYPRVSSDSTSTPFVFEKQVDMFMTKYRKGMARLVPIKMKRWIIAKILRFMYKPIKVTCSLKTISQIIAENQITRIDLLKLDAENAERQVIEGINEHDWEKIQQITMELHTNIPGGKTLVSDIINLLESKGFKYELDTNSRFSYVGVHMLYAKK
jgi:FkbM family methyltransferase